MTILSDVQVLEPGAKVTLFVLDVSVIGGPVLRFHAHTKAGSIWWQGLEYTPWPIRADGFARTSSGQPNPTVSVSNLDGSITALCMEYEDLVGAVFWRRQTFGRYLDAVNFPGGVNPTADPGEEMPSEIWYVERKVTETREQVQFELSSAMDFNGMMLPSRPILATKCAWLVKGGYRGPYCNYTGPAVAKYDGTPTSNMAEDKCGGRVSDCKLRFGANNPLSYGSFAAAGLLR